MLFFVGRESNFLCCLQREDLGNLTLCLAKIYIFWLNMQSCKQATITTQHIAKDALL